MVHALTFLSRRAFLNVRFQFKKFFILRGDDVIEFVLGNIDVRNIGIAPIEEMSKNHSVYRLMADNHDVVGMSV